MHCYDIFPASIEKFNAINNTLNESDNNLKYKMQFLYPFSIYHFRWNQLKKEDFVYDRNNFMGSEMVFKVSKPDNGYDYDLVSIDKYDETINTEYIEKFIKNCNDNNIQLLLTYLPFPANEEKINESKIVELISEKYNVNYINFLNESIVDFNTDLYDSNSHLNISGARKITSYLGKYINEHYKIEHSNNDDYWNDLYNKYIDYKLKNINDNKNNVNVFLTTLQNDNDINFEIFFKK